MGTIWEKEVSRSRKIIIEGKGHELDYNIYKYEIAKHLKHKNIL